MHHAIWTDLHELHQHFHQQIAALERELASDLVQTPYVRLLAIPGINVVSAAELAAELGPITRYANANSITGRSGLYPSRHLSWDTPQVERTLLAVAQQAEKREYGGRQVAIVLPWFIEREKAEAIPLILNNLEESEVYSAVVGTKHTSYLEALRQKLADLQDGTLTGPALYRRRQVRHHAELILIMGEQSDPIPKLMQFAADPENDYERQFAIRRLHARADSRIVSWAEDRLRTENDDYQRFCIIRLLGTLPGREADKVLIGLLSRNARQAQVSHQEEIVKALETRTGKNYGADSVKWQNWLQEETGR
jgi:hypothetical protein